MGKRSLDIEFAVEGRPVPQGSMTASYNRQTKVAHVHHVQGAALAVWRASIRESARQAMRGQRPEHRAIDIALVFLMPRPVSHIRLNYGRQTIRERYVSAQVTTSPDIDKLIRAALDAMTGIVYIDDSQVVNLHAREMYALNPGMRARVRDYEWTPEADTGWLGEGDPVRTVEGQSDMLPLWERRGG